MWNNWYYSAKSRLRYKLIRANGSGIARSFSVGNGESPRWSRSSDLQLIIGHSSWRLCRQNYRFMKPNHEPSTRNRSWDWRSIGRFSPIELTSHQSRIHFQALWTEDGKTLSNSPAACSAQPVIESSFSCWILWDIFCEWKMPGISSNVNVVKQNGVILEGGMIPIQGREFYGFWRRTIPATFHGVNGARWSIIHCRYVPWNRCSTAPIWKRLIWKEQTLERGLDLPVPFGENLAIVSWRLGKPEPFPKLPRKHTELFADFPIQMDG